jgi:hypothetical protein
MRLLYQLTKMHHGLRDGELHFSFSISSNVVSDPLSTLSRRLIASAALPRTMCMHYWALLSLVSHYIKCTRATIMNGRKRLVETHCLLLSMLSSGFGLWCVIPNSLLFFLMLTRILSYSQCRMPLGCLSCPNSSDRSALR